ncbi:hypothetical protein [Streptomyces sp. DSM 118878]
MSELRAGPFAEDLAAGFDVPIDLAREMAGRVDEPMRPAELAKILRRHWSTR